MKIAGSYRSGSPKGSREYDWHDTPPEDARREVVSGYDTAIGLDLSYSGSGDSAAVCVVSREAKDAHADRYYVRDIWSGPRELRSLRVTLAAYQARFPDAQLVSYVSGMEKGVLGLLAEESRDPDGRPIPSLNVLPMLATDSKVARAAGTIELWNMGRIVLPHREWARDLARKVQSFDGTPSGSDDEVDALVSAVEYLRRVGGASVGIMTARRTSR
jgi:hypothetical protein